MDKGIGGAIISLFNHCPDSLSEDMLSEIASLSHSVNLELGNLSKMVGGIAGLVACDKDAGNFTGREDQSDLLWGISGQVDMLRAVNVISSQAGELLHLRRTNKQDGNPDGDLPVH